MLFGGDHYKHPSIAQQRFILIFYSTYAFAALTPYQAMLIQTGRDWKATGRIIHFPSPAM